MTTLGRGPAPAVLTCSSHTSIGLQQTWRQQLLRLRGTRPAANKIRDLCSGDSPRTSASRSACRRRRPCDIDQPCRRESILAHSCGSPKTLGRPTGGEGGSQVLCPCACSRHDHFGRTQRLIGRFRCPRTQLPQASRQSHVTPRMPPGSSGTEKAGSLLWSSLTLAVDAQLCGQTIAAASTLTHCGLLQWSRGWPCQQAQGPTRLRR